MIPREVRVYEAYLAELRRQHADLPYCDCEACSEDEK